VVDGRVRKLDEVASGEALVSALGAGGARVRERLDGGDAQALPAVREAGEKLGLAVATVIDLLNPHLVAIGGGLTELPGYLDAARAVAERHTLGDLWQVCEVRRVRAGDQVAALGAARAARERP
jgi:predicted NBD/HSP70 family sugar kinase